MKTKAATQPQNYCCNFTSICSLFLFKQNYPIQLLRRCTLWLGRASPCRVCDLKDKPSGFVLTLPRKFLYLHTYVCVYVKEILRIAICPDDRNLKNFILAVGSEVKAKSLYSDQWCIQTGPPLSGGWGTWVWRLCFPLCSLACGNVSNKLASSLQMSKLGKL